MDEWASYPVAWVPTAAAHMDAPGLSTTAAQIRLQLAVTLTVLPLRACRWLENRRRVPTPGGTPQTAHDYYPGAFMCRFVRLGCSSREAQSQSPAAVPRPGVEMQCVALECRLVDAITDT